MIRVSNTLHKRTNNSYRRLIQGVKTWTNNKKEELKCKMTTRKRKYELEYKWWKILFHVECAIFTLLNFLTVIPHSIVTFLLSMPTSLLAPIYTTLGRSFCFVVPLLPSLGSMSVDFSKRSFLIICLRCSIASFWL